MGAIVTKCPKTGQVVPVGMSMDEASFKSSQMSGNSFKCAACGKMHTWDKKDAWVQKP